jgi:hypothetical protein
MSSVISTLRHRNVRYSMIEDAEYHSLKETYKFLCDLIDPAKYPRIPAKIRKNASRCLRHYPIRRDLKEIAETVGFFNPR